MMRYSLRLAAVSLLAATTAGCANIGTINGVRMNATTPSEKTYCEQNEQNRLFCVLFVAGFVGGGIAAVLNGHHSHAPVAPPAPPPA